MTKLFVPKWTSWQFKRIWLFSGKRAALMWNNKQTAWVHRMRAFRRPAWTWRMLSRWQVPAKAWFFLMDENIMNLVFLEQSIDIQTDSALCLDEEVQTFGLIELSEQEMQTDERPMKNQKIQTPLPVLVDAEAQSEEVDLNYRQNIFFRWTKTWRRFMAHDCVKLEDVFDKPSIGQSHAESRTQQCWDGRSLKMFIAEIIW